MTNDDDGDEESRMHKALNLGLLILRYNLGRARVCPVCYCDLLIAALEDIREGYEHGEEVPKMDRQEIVDMLNHIMDDRLASTPPAGSA